MLDIDRYIYIYIICFWHRHRLIWHSRRHSAAMAQGCQAARGCLRVWCCLRVGGLDFSVTRGTFLELWKYLRLWLITPITYDGWWCLWFIHNNMVYWCLSWIMVHHGLLWVCYLQLINIDAARRSYQAGTPSSSPSQEVGCENPGDSQWGGPHG